nr:MAG TPA: hypothetical protein [Bacteriophage sp.]
MRNFGYCGFIYTTKAFLLLLEFLIYLIFLILTQPYCLNHMNSISTYIH